MGILSMFQNPMPDVAPEDYQSSNQSFLNSLPDLSSIKNINLKDYIPDVSMPRVFGSAPAGYEGLLGADRTKSLESSANLQGLLGMASALAQGMSSQGPRRSALQNVLSSLAGGFGGASQAYERGLTQYGQQQQIAQSQIANQQAAELRASVENVMKMPEVANNPALIAALRAEPAKTLAWINENMGISQAYAPSAPTQTTQISTQEQVQPTVDANGEKIMPPVEVVAQGNPLLQQKDRLMMANQKLTGLPGERAQKSIENNLKQIENIDKQIKTEFDIQQKQKDYTNEARRVAASMFPNAPLEELNQGQLTQLQSKLDQIELAKRRAGASSVNVNTGKAFGTEFGKGVAESVANTFSAAQGAQSTLGAIQNIKPLINAGVYAGPLSTVPRVVDQLATSLGVTGRDNSEKLKNTAVAMQGLASLELSAAQAMKGQGAITENERGLIKRAAAGDLQTFTQPEVLSLLNALEKTSQFKIKAHEKNLTRLKNRPDTADLADFYSLEQPIQQSNQPQQDRVRSYNPATGKLE